MVKLERISAHRRMNSLRRVIGEINKIIDVIEELQAKIEVLEKQAKQMSQKSPHTGS